jgi:hypothetical protein
MVRRSFTAVLERNATFTSDFVTEPYEVAWAAEARVFVRVLELSEGSTVAVKPQISPDGLFWCDEGSPGCVSDSPGLMSFAVSNFGHWLRLNGALAGDQPASKVIVYLALKE